MSDVADRRTSRANSLRSDQVVLVSLAVITVFSVLVVEAHVSQTGRAVWIAVILGLGFAKTVAIGLWYMMLRQAPRALLGAFLAWATAFAVVLIVIVIAAPSR